MCLDFDPVFVWYDPPVTHIHWDTQSPVCRVVRWANNVAQGKGYRHKTSLKAEFIEGGAIGPVPKKR